MAATASANQLGPPRVERGASRTDLAQRAESIGERARQAAVTLKALRALAQDGPDRAERFLLLRLAEGAIALRRHALNGLRIEVVLEPAPDDLFVVAGRRAIMQVILNLVLNAEQVLAGSPSGSLRLQTRRRGAAAELIVEDNGPGLHDAPGFDDGPTIGALPVLAGSNQLGIGLGVARWLAESQGGRLSWTAPDRGSGCRMTLSLPAAS